MLKVLMTLMGIILVILIIWIVVKMMLSVSKINDHSSKMM